MHSWSSATSRSPTPDLRQCTREPPSSSCVTSSPTAARTRCGPASAIDPRPLTIGTKSARPGMYAVPAAHGPISAATCGMTPDATTSSRNRWPRAGEERPDRLLDPRARRVEQPHHRHPLGQRQLAQPRDLDLAGHAHRAGHHREVVGGDRDHPPVDLPVAGDDAVGRRLLVLQAAHGVVDPGVQPQLVERARDRPAGRSAPAPSACRPRAAWRSAPRRPRASRRPAAPCSSSTSGRSREVGAFVTSVIRSRKSYFPLRPSSSGTRSRHAASGHAGGHPPIAP